MSLSDERKYVKLFSHTNQFGDDVYFELTAYPEEAVKEFIDKIIKIVQNNSSIRYEKRKHFIKRIKEEAGPKLIGKSECEKVLAGERLR